MSLTFTHSSDSDYSTMGDAAYADDLDGTSFNAVGGYLHSPNAFHPWSTGDWQKIPGPKLPIWVANFGRKNGRDDGRSIVAQLAALNVPSGKLVVVDLEESEDESYVNSLYSEVHDNYGYKVWVYGSLDTVFHNPACNGYWVADYVGTTPFMVNHPQVRATQWKRGDKFDTSAVLGWTLREFWT